MGGAASYPRGVQATQAAGTRWRVRDFVLIMAGGLATGIAALLGTLAAEASQEVTLVATSVAQYGGHLVILGRLARRRGGMGELGFTIQASDLVYLFLGVLLQITVPLLFLPLANLVGEGQPAQALGEQIQGLAGMVPRAMMAVVVAVLAPVTEELMFRGVLLRAVPGGARRSMVVTALVFSVFHVFGLSGDFLRGLILTVPTFFLVGLIMASVTIRRRRLGPAIFIHSGFNLLALLVLFLPAELLEQARQTAG